MYTPVLLIKMEFAGVKITWMCEHYVEITGLPHYDAIIRVNRKRLCYK